MARICYILKFFWQCSICQGSKSTLVKKQTDGQTDREIQRENTTAPLPEATFLCCCLSFSEPGSHGSSCLFLLVWGLQDYTWVSIRFLYQETTAMTKLAQSQALSQCPISGRLWPAPPQTQSRHLHVHVCKQLRATRGTCSWQSRVNLQGREDIVRRRVCS